MRRETAAVHVYYDDTAWCYSRVDAEGDEIVCEGASRDASEAWEQGCELAGSYRVPCVRFAKGTHEELERWEPAYRVMAYDDARELGRKATAELRDASRDADPTGAVPAYRDERGVWHYVRPSGVEHARRHLHLDVLTVYIEWLT